MSRINELYKNCAGYNYIADIGSDHALLSQKILKNNPHARVIFSDISAPCLNKGIKLLRGYIEQDRAQAVHCFGLDGIDKKIELAVIAGMGGIEIIKILNTAPFKPPALLLQPMKSVRQVREFLLAYGYKIIKDFVIFDKKYYDIILAERGSGSYTEKELEYGQNCGNPVFLQKIKREIEKNLSYLKRGIKNPRIIEDRIRELEQMTNYK